ncbi:MAG: domain containing protein [Candidatus Peribacteria bacterium]|nr:domain containing protein [Candidatus Peribacteria bacterium]
MAPDNRIFVAQQQGKVVIFKDNQLLATPALNLPVGNGGDRGLLGITLDPAFPASPYVYLFYTSTALHQRVSRFTMSGNTISPASELILLENPATWGGALNAGTVRFGPDGKLYATLGNDGKGLTSQDLSALEGKMIRINKDGTIPPDNPFYDTPGAQKAIYAMGFRNPWHFNFDEQGRPIVGDVGQNLYEKIIRVQAGANYGWPTVEGDCRPNCGGITPPVFVIAHNGQGTSVLGGDTYRGQNFPAQYQHQYFYGDYVQGTIKTVTIDANGNASNFQSFEGQAGALSNIAFGADGCMYTLTIFPGNLFKTCYTQTRSGILTVKAGSDKTSGDLPLTVRFTSTGSNDSLGHALTYAWTFGDGATSTEASPAHTYTTKGVYTATLSVNNDNEMQSANVTVWAGYKPPVISITSPAANAKYVAGDSIHFAGTATDTAGNPLPASAYFWKIIPHHNTHIHTPDEIQGVTAGNYVIPREGEPDPNTWFVFDLVVTDSAGLSTELQVPVYPTVATLGLASNPNGAQLLLDGQPFTTPYQTQSVAGIQRTLSIASPQTISGTSYTFTSWSDGGTASHTFFSPSVNQTYTATLSTGQLPPVVPPACNTPGTNAFTSCYYSGKNFSSLKLARTDGALSFDWGGGSPDPVVPADNFSLKSQGNFTFKAGDYDFTAVADDGVRVSVDGTVIIDKFTDQPATTYNVTKTMTAGSHLVLFEYYEAYGNAVAKLSWAKRDDVLPPPADTTPPVTAITDPADKATVTGASVITASATDASGIASVQFLVDNAPFGPTDTAAPYGIAWDTTLIANGPHTLSAKARDTAGNETTSPPVTVTVNNNIAPPPPPPPTFTSFVVSASMPKNIFQPGDPTTVTTNVAATNAVPNVSIVTKIYSSTGTELLSHVVTTNLVKNQLFSNDWAVTLPAANGKYIVKIGVFSANYSTLYFWKNSAFVFTVGTPPGPPNPGSTYPIHLLFPTANSTISGLQEIRAVIDGLDINTYNIGWRTGNGQFFNLDTEPVTESFKHAWVDFSTWTWRTLNNIYPMDFQVTDLQNTVIGSESINVTVVPPNGTGH